MDKVIAKRYLADVVDFKKQFRLYSGARFVNLYDLDEFLPVMHDNVFVHHVNSSRNDFSKWIDNVIGDKELSASIELIKDKKKMHSLISSRIIELEKVIKKNSKQSGFVVKDAKKQQKSIINDDIKFGLAQSNILENKMLRKIRDNRIKKNRPKKHEYMRGHHEHIHYGIWDFLYGLVCGIFLTLIVLRVFGYLY